MRELKQSGVEWLGNIPANWETIRIGSIYQVRNTKVSDKDYLPLSVGYMGVVPQLENAAKTDDGDNRKLVLKNDFVINSRADRRGACGISDYDGSVSLINIVLKPLKNACNDYYRYLFKSTAFSDEFYKWGNGIVDDLWSTKWSEMKRIMISVPPLTTQIAIADYLDDKCGKIDALIGNEESVITELKEYKKSIIQKAIEENCESWEKKRVRYMFKFLRGAGISKEFQQEEGVPCIHYGGIHFSYGFSVDPDKNNVWCIDETIADSFPNAVLQRGDFLFVDTSEDLEGSGNFTLFDSNRKTVAGQGCILLRPVDKFLSRFMAYQFDSYAFRKQIQSSVYGVKVYHPTQQIIKTCYAYLPPLPEQKAIVDYLDKKTKEVDELIAIKQQKIAELKEYKKSLIYECVTGKKEVV